MLPNQPTIFDVINAGKYSRQRLLKDICQSPETQQKYPGVGWVVDRRTRDFNCPVGLEDCEQDSGHCKFLTRESCLAQSGDYRDQGTGKKPYLEWHAEETGAVGKDGENIGKCIVGNFALRNYCENPHSRRAGQSIPGITNVPPFQYDQQRGLCLMTKPYCKYMAVGFTDRNDDFYKKTGIDIPDCHVSGFDKYGPMIFGGQVIFKGFRRGLYQKFLENAAEDIFEGDAGIYEGKWPPFHKFVEDASSGKFNEELGIGVDYSGQTGETLSRPEKGPSEVRKKIKKDFIDGFEKIKQDFMKNATKKEGFNENVEISCDEKLMDSKKIFSKDFAGPGINLYLIEWNAEFIKKNPKRSLKELGFICSELERAGLIPAEKDGHKIIKLNKADTYKDRNLRRVYFVSNNPGFVINLMGNFALKTNVMKKFMEERNKT